MKHIFISLSLFVLAACSTGNAFSEVNPDFAWHITSTTIVYDEFAPPIVSLSLIDTKTSTEYYSTNCDGTASTGVTLDDLAIVSNIRCWWAGGGEDIVVFEGEQDHFTVQRRWIDEESGEGPWEMAE